MRVNVALLQSKDISQESNINESFNDQWLLRRVFFPPINCIRPRLGFTHETPWMKSENLSMCCPAQQCDVMAAIHSLSSGERTLFLMVLFFYLWYILSKMYDYNHYPFLYTMIPTKHWYWNHRMIRIKYLYIKYTYLLRNRL